MSAPVVPTTDASWFQVLKAQNKKAIHPQFRGDGVPLNSAIKPQENHGYWLRYNRQKPGGAAIPPSYAFYYTGTGPRGNLKFGEYPPNDSKDTSRITWVKAKGADTSIKPHVAKRNPNNPKHALLPLRFPSGDGPAAGFRVDPFNTRGRQLERAPGPRSMSMDTRPAANQPRKRDQSAPAAVRRKTQHQAPKRTLQKGKTISQVFGHRSRTGANVGSADTEKSGMADPRIMALARYVPGVQEMLFAGHVDSQFQVNDITLTFTYSITVKENSPDYIRIKDALSTVVNQTYEPPTKPKKEKKPVEQASKNNQQKKKPAKQETAKPDNSADLEWDDAFEIKQDSSA
ncbi:nucleocapsid phosphoprotein [Thrush coronavirus HKU12-600]|uniref:Nucleocapsid phosphoprotein n=1 Tax=Thrush coronavirus HKU12 (isolate Grey-backed thrush/Hong Kong/HKU12-600/2007) TaxID=572290 RepID=B6VDY2_THCOV|nr:nucleocapsid phosphoprotein [Thrush coronavirus HKU12-600]ACJ12057.1 nucleocapsid phosphoprotein [Thrush coronavirus HKU12-600]